MPLVLLPSEFLYSYFPTIHFHIISATSNMVHLINVIRKCLPMFDCGLANTAFEIFRSCMHSDNMRSCDRHCRQNISAEGAFKPPILSYEHHFWTKFIYILIFKTWNFRQISIFYFFISLMISILTGNNSFKILCNDFDFILVKRGKLFQEGIFFNKGNQ